MSGCRSDDGPLHMEEEGGANSGGTADGGTTATGGSTETGGTAPGTGGDSSTGGTGSIEGGTTSTEGGSQSGAGGGSDAGAGPTGGTTTVSGGSGGSGGGGGWTDGGVAGDTGTTRCVYYTPGDEVIDQGGAGGAGPPLTIKSQKSSFVGAYLTDGAGKALYTYGADFPGDCDNVPITNCFKDCAISWPPFHGEPRNLGNGLDDSMFGTIERTDGTVDAPIVSRQMTYMGWPLYYYKSDLAPNDTKGHASGVWQLATVIPPNIMVVRVPSGMSTVKVVTDEGGHTLYTYANDTKGTATAPPKSACTGSCLDAFEPFVVTYLSPVSYLPPSNFSFFVRSDGSPQIAYKGAPLYLSLADTRSGQSNGLATPGWSVAAQ